MALGLLAYGLAYLAIAPVVGPEGAVPALALAVILATVGEMLVYPYEASFVADLSPVAVRGRYQGMLGAAVGLGSAVGPPVGGLMLDLAPGAPTWIAVSAAAAVAAGGLWVLGNPVRRLLARQEATAQRGTCVSETRPPVHPDNDLNELSGEEWLYFTKSLWTTAYPSELGHQLRKAHGANKPPRLMARLIEFFTRGGELVLDPFAGVGGTLLGAAVCRAPRRAVGFELEPRWAAIYELVVREALAERDGRGAQLADMGASDPGGPRTFDPSGCKLLTGDALTLLPGMADGTVDFVATDPPYNPQLRITMSGGPLAREHANRRTDYAMVTDSPADLANSTSYGEYLDRMEEVFRELRRVLRDRRYAAVIVRDAYQDGRYRFTAADLAARASAAGFVPKGDLIWYQAGTRLRPYGYPRSFVPNIVHQHIVVLRAG